MLYENQIRYWQRSTFGLGTKILPAELQKTRVSLNRFYNILQQTRNRSNNYFRFLVNVPIIANNRTHNLLLEQRCKSKWSNGSIVRNCIGKWNTLPITIRKETSKTKFKQKVTAEMLKRHERVPMAEGLQDSNIFFINLF